jgi:hypothetical protein
LLSGLLLTTSNHLVFILIIDEFAPCCAVIGSRLDSRACPVSVSGGYHLV